MRRVWARLRRRNRGSSWSSESFGMASTGVGWDGFLVMAFSFGVFAALCTIGEYKGRGKSRAVEKSKSRTFPRHLKIPQLQRDFHFSHRPGYGGREFLATFRKNFHHDLPRNTISPPRAP